MTLEQRYDGLRQTWSERAVRLEYLALGLKEIVDERSDVLPYEASRRATKSWGKIEIINALVLDSGNELSPSDVDDVDELLGELRTILFG